MPNWYHTAVEQLELWYSTVDTDQELRLVLVYGYEKIRLVLASTSRDRSRRLNKRSLKSQPSIKPLISTAAEMIILTNHPVQHLGAQRTLNYNLSPSVNPQSESTHHPQKTLKSRHALLLHPRLPPPRHGHAFRLLSRADPRH